MRKTNFLWKHKDGHLTVKAKKWLNEKLTNYWVIEKRRRLERIILAKPKEELLLNTKFIYSVKMKYNSDRGRNFDFMTEITLIIIADKEPSDEALQDILFRELEEDDLNYFMLNIPFTSIDFGLISEEPTNNYAEIILNKVKYSHTLN